MSFSAGLFSGSILVFGGVYFGIQFHVWLGGLPILRCSEGLWHITFWDIYKASFGKPSSRIGITTVFEHYSSVN